MRPSRRVSRRNNSAWEALVSRGQRFPSRAVARKKLRDWSISFTSMNQGRWGEIGGIFPAPIFSARLESSGPNAAIRGSP